MYVVSMFNKEGDVKYLRCFSENPSHTDTEMWYWTKWRWNACVFEDKMQVDSVLWLLVRKGKRRKYPFTQCSHFTMEKV